MAQTEADTSIDSLEGFDTDDEEPTSEGLLNDNTSLEEVRPTTDCTTSDTRVVSLRMTQIQIDAIKQFFDQNEWDYVEVTSSAEISSTRCEEENSKSSFVIQQTPNESECPHCLCRPCITSERNRQMWWERRQQPPRDENSDTRKRLYKFFWTMLLHRRVWEDERYLARKLTSLQQDPQQRNLPWIGDRYHKRDLINPRMN